MELETKADELQIGGFGVTLTTLEEVFLKIASENDNETTQDSTAVDIQVNLNLLLLLYFYYIILLFNI